MIKKKPAQIRNMISPFKPWIIADFYVFSLTIQELSSFTSTQDKKSGFKHKRNKKQKINLQREKCLVKR